MKRASLLAVGAALAALLALAAGAAAAGDAVRIAVEGLPVYAQSAPGDRVVLRAYVRAGRGAAPPGQGALADLTAVWMVRGGTGSLAGQDFAAALAALGAEVSGAADRDLLAIELRVDPAKLHAGARLFADLLMYPAFDPDAAEAALAEVEEEESAAPGDDPGLVQLRAWIQGNPPEEAPARDVMPRSRRGREAVARFHRDHVGVDTTVVVVEGPLEGINLEHEMRSAFLGFRRAAAPSALPEPASAAAGGAPAIGAASVALREVKPGRTRLLIGRTGLTRQHPDWLAVAAGMAAIAGRDVSSDLAERSLPGPIASRARIDLPLSGPDLMWVDLTLPTAAVDGASAAYDRAFALLRDGRLTSTDFERAKRFLALGILPKPDAEHAARAYALLEALGGPGRAPGEWWLALAELSRGTVTKAAAAYLR